MSESASASADVIAANLADVRARIHRAALAARRPPSSVRLIAVSKTFPAEAVRAAVAAGQRDFGENRVQEALAKMDALTDTEAVWHLIGHLQSNKAKKAAARFRTIHSVDSLDLLRHLDQAAQEAGTAPELLVQVDLAGEATKHGIAPESLEPLFEYAERCTSARVVGLMIIPPYFDNPEDVRPYFRRLAETRAILTDKGLPAAMLRELSMGMSHDFETAVAEGATLVRVGTAIFGRRPPAESKL